MAIRTKATVSLNHNTAAVPLKDMVTRERHKVAVVVADLAMVRRVHPAVGGRFLSTSKRSRTSPSSPV